jgi:hypothetical protein
MTGRMGELWAKLVGQPARVLLAAAGVLLMVAAFFQRHGKDFADFVLVLGAVLLVASAALPRLRSLKASPSGFEAEFDAEAQAVTSTRIAEDPAGTIDLHRDETVGAARFLAAVAALTALFEDQATILGRCAVRVFLYDADRDRLLPASFPRTRLRNGGRTQLGYTDRVMAIGSLLAARGGLKKMRSCAVSTTGSGTRGTPRLGDNGA